MSWFSSFTVPAKKVETKLDLQAQAIMAYTMLTPVERTKLHALAFKALSEHRTELEAISPSIAPLLAALRP